MVELFFKKPSVTDFQLQTIAAIILNWGSAEQVLNISLESLYSLEHEDRTHIIYGSILNKKIKLLREKTLDHQYKIKIKEILDELESVLIECKWQRDLLAHGILGTNSRNKQKAFVFYNKSRKRLDLLDLSDLDTAFSSSVHIFRLAEKLLKLTIKS